LPTLSDLRRYSCAVRCKNSSQTINATIDFLEEIFLKEFTNSEIQDKFLIGEIAYSLYVMCAIQDINGGDSIDAVHFEKAQKYLEECKKYKMAKNDLFEYEWLGRKETNGKQKGTEKFHDK
jgi:hypothetical protein